MFKTAMISDRCNALLARNRHGGSGRLLENARCEIAAPLGLDDLFDLIIRPGEGSPQRKMLSTKSASSPKAG